jgi:hypothetical protein
VVIFQYGGHPDFHSRADDNIALWSKNTEIDH